MTVSQAGLEPIRAGRFFVHTPTHQGPAGGRDQLRDRRRPRLRHRPARDHRRLPAALDRLERDGASFANIADIGTGTGLLAFAALALWPEARAIATDIDPVAIEVTPRQCGDQRRAARPRRRRAAAGGRRRHGLADARPPARRSTCIIANILAGPLIELAPAFAKALAPGGTMILAGLLDTQADAVAAAYEALGCTLVDRGSGEWPVLVLSVPKPDADRSCAP